MLLSPFQGDSISVEYWKEGIEGLFATVDDGSFVITSQDDGINSAGGADSSGFGGGRPRQDSFSEGSDCFIMINGGDVTTNDGSENNPGQMRGAVGNKGEMERNRPEQ